MSEAFVSQDQEFLEKAQKYIDERVKVYTDPLTQEEAEGIAVIKSVASIEGQYDELGNPHLFLGEVEFESDGIKVARLFSIPDNIIWRSNHPRALNG